MAIEKRGQSFVVRAWNPLTKKHRYFGSYRTVEAAKVAEARGKSTIKKAIARKEAKDSEPVERATTLYRCYDSEETLLYVGITSQRHRRFVQHSKGSDWWPRVATLQLEHYPTTSEAKAAEREQVAKLDPPHNVKLRREREDVTVMYRKCRNCGQMFRPSSHVRRRAKTWCEPCLERLVTSAISDQHEEESA